jgi:hypothetical protein
MYLALLVVLVSGIGVTPVYAQYWQNADLTAITGGPRAMYFSAMASVADPQWHTMRTHYLGYDRHVHELFLSAGGWQEADLTALTGGPRAYPGGSLAIAYDPPRSTMRTHYVDENRHVRELFLSAGQWREADLTALAGGHLAAGPLAIAFDPAWQTMRTHYICVNSHVHELFLSSSGWQNANLTALTGGPSADTISSVAMVFDPVWNGMRTHYFSSTGHVHELFLNGFQWQNADLTALARGPASYGSIRIAFDPHSSAVRSIYIVANGSAQNAHVHELSLSGGLWRDADLTAIAGAPAIRSAGDIAFDPRWNTTRVHYVGIDRHVHELFLANGRWQDADLTALTGGPVGIGTITMAFDPVWNGMRTHYNASATEHVNELFLVP